MKAFLTWLLVAAPLGWGVAKSVEKSLPLFRDAKKIPEQTAGKERP